jgi:hypothetical protein
MHAASQHAQHSADRMTLCTINADSCATARVFADEPHHHQYPYSHHQYPYSHRQYPYSHRQYPYSLRACLQTSHIIISTLIRIGSTLIRIGSTLIRIGSTLIHCACLQTSRINGDLAESRPSHPPPRFPGYPQGPALPVPKADTGLRDRRPPRRSTVLGVRLCEVRALAHKTTLGM